MESYLKLFVQSFLMNKTENESSLQIISQTNAKLYNKESNFELVLKDVIVKIQDDSTMDRSQSDVKPNQKYQNSELIVSQKMQEDCVIRKNHLNQSSTTFKMIDESTLSKSKPDEKSDFTKSKFMVQIEGENKLLKQVSNSNREGQAKRRRINWKLEQHLRYMSFISNPLNRIQLEALQKKHKQGIYNRMAAKLQNRSAHKCKSHHQKMIAKYSTIDRILKELPEHLEELEKMKMAKVKEEQVCQ